MVDRATLDQVKRHPHPKRKGLLRLWRERGARKVRLQLPLQDVMDFALALLSVPPAELQALGWTFADRKRLLNHFLASGKVVQKARSEDLSGTLIKLTLPRRDVELLQRFAHRELPKAASDAAMLDRVLTALDGTARAASP